MIKYKRWIESVLLPILILIFMNMGKIFAQSSTNYKIKKSVTDQGGTASQSTNHKLVDAVGQPSAIGMMISSNYRIVSGFFSASVIVQNPVLSVSPTTLDFSTDKNSMTFQISNAGFGTLNWNVNEIPDKPWITSITPSTGNNDATVTVTVDRNQLSGNSDTGTIAVNSNGGNQNVIVLITNQSVGVPIFLNASSPQMVGSEFWIDIDIGTSANPVANLFGVSFDLDFTNTNYIDVVTPHSNNVISGSFIGSDVIFFPNVDETSGKVNIGISRKSGQGGVHGFGTVARVKFMANSNTPNDTQVQFSLSNVSANDPSGSNIPLNPGTLTVTISSLLVWPGDTNNDGVVNQADVLPLGLHWSKTGPVRQNPSTSWTGQPATAWSPESATYADANGDGTINQVDVLPIGLNWNKTHSTILARKAITPFKTINKFNTPNLMIVINGDSDPDQDFFIDIIINEVSNLFGLSFELVYSPTSFIDPLSVEQGTNNLLGNDLIFFPFINKNVGIDTGKVSVGISRKFGQGGVDGSGLATRITAHMSPNAIIGQSTTTLTLENIQANDPDGNPIEFNASNFALVTDVETASDNIPLGFALFENYPNPFNPETTIEYQLPQSAEVMLTIYDVQGHEVRRLVHGTKSAGYHSVQWDSRNELGKFVASGIYLYRIEVKSKVAGQRSYVNVKKMILMK